MFMKPIRSNNTIEHPSYASGNLGGLGAGPHADNTVSSTFRKEFKNGF